MEGIDPKQKLEELEAKKRELIDKAKAINAGMKSVRDELIRLVPSLRGKAWLRGEKAKTEVDDIEFEISTTAFTPAQEKTLLKKLKKKQDEMDQALKLDGMRDKVDAGRKKIDDFVAERNAVDASLKEVRDQLEATYKEILATNKENYRQIQDKRDAERNRHYEERGRQDMVRRHREREDRRKEEQKEIAPYMKQHDDFVSLEEIAEIKKKPAKPAETE